VVRCFANLLLLIYVPIFCEPIIVVTQNTSFLRPMHFARLSNNLRVVSTEVYINGMETTWG